VIRAPGAHDWSTIPGWPGGSYQGYAQAAQVVARQERAGDGIVYQSQEGEDKWLMIGYGLSTTWPGSAPRHPAPAQLFIAETGAQATGMYPLPCQHPGACWAPSRGSGSWPAAPPRQPVSAVTGLRRRAAAALPARRGPARPSLTVFLLVRQ